MDQTWHVAVPERCCFGVLMTCLCFFPPQVPHQMAGGTQGLPALQHASAAAGTAAQQAGPRPSSGSPTWSREHRIALHQHGLPRGCWGYLETTKALRHQQRSQAGDGRMES